MSNNSFNKILVTLIILVMVLSGLSVISSLWGHEATPIHANAEHAPSVSYSPSQAAGKQNVVIENLSLGNGAGPTQIAFDPVNGYLYVSNTGNGTISVINATSNSVVGTINLGSSSEPSVVAYDPANNYIYSGAISTKNLSIINTTTDTVVENISISASFSGIVYDPANTYMYIGNAGNSISVLNSTTNKVVGSFMMDQTVEGMAYDSSNASIYVAVFSNEIQYINSTTNEIAGTINLASSPAGIAYDSANNTLFVDNPSLGTVSMINATTGKIVVNTTIGPSTTSMDNFEGVSYDPAFNSLYVSNFVSGNVSVINATNGKLVTNLTVGSNPEGIVYDPANGYTYVANAASDDVSVIALMNTYKVTFTEANLPVGANWFVNITGQKSSGPISGNSYTIDLLNNTYTYSTATTAQYASAHYLETFDVNGSQLSVAIPFYKAYKVMFKESGLPSGTGWKVMVSGQQGTGTLTGNSSTINLPNGTYTYVTSSSISNFEAYGNTTFTVNGSSVTEHISFVETYKVVFDTYEIPTGQVWYVNLTNGNSYKSKAPPMETLPANVPMVTSTVLFSVPNGTYYYNIATVDKNYEPNGTFAVHIMAVEPVGFTSSLSSGSFTVNGAALYEGVNFSYAFKTTFTDSGLPSGTPWYVNLSNGQALTSNTTTITSYEPNGTYSYTVATADKTYSPDKGSGTFTVNNSSVSETATFSKVLSKVTFIESGLPSGTAWYVNGTGVSENSTSQNMVFELTNGTYTFTATNLSSYYTSASQFTVTIKGYNVSENVHYYHWAYITGTVLPGNATLTFNGKDVAVSSNGSFNVSVANGTYDIVATDTGYHSFNTNVTLGNGAVKHISIDLKALHQNNPISQDVIYGAIAGVVAVAIVGIAVYTMRKR